MTFKNFIATLLLLTPLLLVPLVPAQAAKQDETPSTEPGNTETATKETSPGSQEVEYNDDNYRRYMELKDQPTERSSMPTNTFQPGTQKLDKLPEASQKHLRNQLREIILEGGEWAPGDEDNEYPYIASEAAQKNATLQQQEAEAWGELVGKYHEREAQIYANSSRSKSVAGAESGTPDVSQAQANAAGSAGESAASGASSSEESGAGDKQKQPGREMQSAANPNEGSYSLSSSSSSAASNDPDAVSISGVSQSALEYLMNNNKIPGSGQQSTPPGVQATPEPGQLVVISADTLSIEDLQNAQGITITTGTGSSQAAAIEIEAESKGSLHVDEDG